MKIDNNRKEIEILEKTRSELGSPSLPASYFLEILKGFLVGGLILFMCYGFYKYGSEYLWIIGITAGGVILLFLGTWSAFFPVLGVIFILAGFSVIYKSFDPQGVIVSISGAIFFALINVVRVERIKKKLQRISEIDTKVSNLNLEITDEYERIENEKRLEILSHASPYVREYINDIFEKFKVTDKVTDNISLFSKLILLQKCKLDYDKEKISKIDSEIFQKEKKSLIEGIREKISGKHVLIRADKEFDFEEFGQWFVSKVNSFAEAGEFDSESDLKDGKIVFTLSKNNHKLMFITHGSDENDEQFIQVITQSSDIIVSENDLSLQDVLRINSVPVWSFKKRTLAYHFMPEMPCFAMNTMTIRTLEQVEMKQFTLMLMLSMHVFVNTNFKKGTINISDKYERESFVKHLDIYMLLIGILKNPQYIKNQEGTKIIDMIEDEEKVVYSVKSEEKIFEVHLSIISFTEVNPPLKIVRILIPIKPLQEIVNFKEYEDLIEYNTQYVCPCITKIGETEYFCNKIDQIIINQDQKDIEYLISNVVKHTKTML